MFDPHRCVQSHIDYCGCRVSDSSLCMQGVRKSIVCAGCQKVAQVCVGCQTVCRVCRMSFLCVGCQKVFCVCRLSESRTGVCRLSQVLFCLGFRARSTQVRARSQKVLFRVQEGEVGGWGRYPKKCTGRDWGMGSSTI